MPRNSGYPKCGTRLLPAWKIASQAAASEANLQSGELRVASCG